MHSSGPSTFKSLSTVSEVLTEQMEINLHIIDRKQDCHQQHFPCSELNSVHQINKVERCHIYSNESSHSVIPISSQVDWVVCSLVIDCSSRSHFRLMKLASWFLCFCSMYVSLWPGRCLLQDYSTLPSRVDRCNIKQSFLLKNIDWLVQELKPTILQSGVQHPWPLSHVPPQLIIEAMQ